ncbi:MAG TPA: TRAP transporter substrate-binding protein DctP [Ottowia sp.]|jgi:TRAP-type mannitol/chloroaromatic compound transport system substrate-binding protein|nr:MAG: ABC transporter substrate-binding protein [Burkholderiales bacterium 68-10]HMT82020.1 TRAP transporter substrate-binding protein DctP [Ottowia sp.]HOM21718.1 TRAP transporter substrate-binding protein DctP [Ottowia sp.]HON30643.1 TRAP transporter substrate-binding protein DctP [Ottowia sp.]HPP98370.1 TRAP transporter substrate-binding protein DctP [Ottowia sp.]
MDRRSLVKGAGAAGAAVVAGMLAACGKKEDAPAPAPAPAAAPASPAAPAVHAGETVRWRLATSFPKSLETLHGCAVKFSETVKQLSGGKFEVSVHAAGELMPAFGIVDALADDSIEMGESASYYYAGKDPAFSFGTAVPFGLTAQQMLAWKLHGNGGKLMDELYGRYNFFALPALNTGTQMGGWYRKEMNKPEDFKGLKMRLGGGVFGESMAKLGVVAQSMPGGEVYQALEKGTLDAAEFVGPYDDEKMGWNKVVKYYYYGGWFEGGAELEFYINKKAFAKLSPENQAIVRAAAAVAYSDGTTKYLHLNPISLKRLVASGTQLKRFNKEIIQAAFKATEEVYAEHSAKDPFFKKVFEDMRAFQRDQILWNRISELVYTQDMASLKI